MSIYDVIGEDLKNDRQFVNMTIGIVSNLEDPEGLGRIKVKLTNRSNSDYETDWIRVLTPMAGNAWGMFFLPEINDEVLVGFCDGDLCKPYVLGSLWSKEKTLPESITVKDGAPDNDIRMIKTKSGHTLLFGDKEGEENIQIVTKSGINLNMSDKDNLIVIGDKDNQNLLKIDINSGLISIMSNSKIEIGSKSSKLTLDGQDPSINLECNGSVSIKGQQVSIEGNSSVAVKASSQLSLESNGSVGVKGSIVKMN